MDYWPEKGMIFWRSSSENKVTVKWSAVERRIRQMIAEGSYLTPAELEKYRSEHLENTPKLEITQADIDEQLKFEATFSPNNLRIYGIYQQNLSVEDTVEAVRKVFGRSFTGYTFPDGTQGRTDYDPVVGITIRKTGADKETAEVTVSWPDAEKRLRQLIKEGHYCSIRPVIKLNLLPFS